MNRVLVALETCEQPKYLARRRLIEKTWARRLPADWDYFAFTGRLLDVPDDYYGLSQKTKAICQFAKFYTYEWLLIVDDDVYVRAERLKPPNADYAGLVLGDREEPFCSGGCYWLSRRAFSLVADAPFNPLIAPSAEDRWVGWVMRENGIKAADVGVVQRPCYCGYCEPKPEPQDWTAYIIDPRYSEEVFLAFESAFGHTR